VLGADNLIGLPKVNLLKRDEIVLLSANFVPEKYLAPVWHQKSTWHQFVAPVCQPMCLRPVWWAVNPEPNMVMVLKLRNY